MIVLNKQEKKHYDRQMRLPEIGLDGQLKIKNASVLVVGAGALGCPVLQYLSASGVGRIGIVDNDWVDESNLHRQVLYDFADIDQPKVVVALDKLKTLNPDVDYTSYCSKYTKGNAIQITQGYDVIVDCTDNFATRYLINDVSVILDKPVVYGAVDRFIGQITVLNYKNGPTLRCISPDIPHPLEVPSCEEIGVLGPMAGVVGSIQAIETIKVILGLDGVLSGKLLAINGLDFSFQFFAFDRDSVQADIKELTEYNDGCMIKIETMNAISIFEFQKMKRKYPDLKVIDLRTDLNKKPLDIENISIPYFELPLMLDHLPKSGPLVFYCDYGVKSALVLDYLRKIGNFQPESLHVLSLKIDF